MTEPNVDIVIDCHDIELLLDFWAAALGYRKSGIRDRYGLLLPDDPVHPPLILQRVREPKTSKTRMRIDLRVDDVETKARELEALGAKRIDVGQPSDATFIPMADPEGNEFCVCPGVPLTNYRTAHRHARTTCDPTTASADQHRGELTDAAARTLPVGTTRRPSREGAVRARCRRRGCRRSGARFGVV
jgi:predicted enzyme related to lactoylglutathione lyase